MISDYTVSLLKLNRWYVVIQELSSLLSECKQETLIKANTKDLQ